MEPLTRSEHIKILASMGVEIPANTKIPDDDLEKRLRAALDAAQEKSRFTTPLNRQALPQWRLKEAGVLDTSSKPLLQAVSRGNWQEAVHNHARGSRTSELFVDPFMDLRQTIMSLANVLDNGLTWCTIQDPEQEKSAINIRFLQVLELDEKTPAMVLLYRSHTRPNAMEGARWVQQQVDQNPKSLGGLGLNISATQLEQKLLFKLLSMNAKLLPANFEVKKQRGEEHYRVSVLLPIGPLGPEAIGKLNSKTGCVICGKAASQRCGQCQSVSYCGADCQRADWREHKRTCRSLKGGRWVKAHFRAVAPGMEGMHTVFINRYSNMSRTEDLLKNTIPPSDPLTAEPPANLHGERLFLVKLQVGIVGLGRDTIMVYDRQRSFGNVYIVRADDEKTFAELVLEMMGPRGGYGGVKMYRWARRLSDWEFSICIDREPEADIKW